MYTHIYIHKQTHHIKQQYHTISNTVCALVRARTRTHQPWTRQDVQALRQGGIPTY